MLENLIRKLKIKRAGDRFVESHPSSNRIFNPGTDRKPGLEKRVSLYFNDKFDSYIGKADHYLPDSKDGKENPDASMPRSIGYFSLAAGSLAAKGVLGVGYAVAEAGSRVTESTFRGIGSLYNKIRAKIKHEEPKKRKITNPNIPLEKVAKRKLKDMAVVGACLGTLALGAYAFSGDDKKAESRPRRPDTHQLAPGLIIHSTRQVASRSPDPISNYQNIHDVLIYCRSDAEKLDVKRTFRARGIRFNRRGKATYRVGRKRMTLHLVTRGERIPQKQYQVVSLRGHSYEMISMYEEVGGGMENRIIHLGGCISERYAPSIRRPGQVVIGNGHIMRTDPNTGIFLGILRSVVSSDSWTQMKDLACNGPYGRLISGYRVTLPPDNTTCEGMSAMR